MQCSHGCGRDGGSPGALGMAYCDECNTDSCLNDEGMCRYNAPCQHDWSDVKRSRLAGTLHRECLECGVIDLDLEEAM